MAVSRRVKIGLGAVALVGAGVLTSAGAAYAADAEPRLRITETVDERPADAVDGGGCDHGGAGDAAASWR